MEAKIVVSLVLAGLLASTAFSSKSQSVDEIANSRPINYLPSKEVELPLSDTLLTPSTRLLHKRLHSKRRPPIRRPPSPIRAPETHVIFMEPPPPPPSTPSPPPPVCGCCRGC
ncbi:unnamed protein product [Amaranthus hypochondriacus]